MADVFIVTSTLPSGDGSLRDALEKAAANGRGVTDTIRFNITRARDLIINIPVNNLLPALSDDLVIDGTTQPGAALGVSDAKVCVAIEGLYSGSGLIYLFDARLTKNVSIYGLFLKGKVVNPSTGARPQLFFGIMLQGSQNIQIGEPGKGNVISGWTTAVYDEYDSRFGKSYNINISSNIFGLDTDGVSLVFGDRTGGNADNTSGIIFKGNSNNFLIGGSTTSEGNLFYSLNTDITVSGEGMNDATTTISNNKFGIDFNGDNIPGNSIAAINVSNLNTFPNYPGIVANPVITKNYIGGQRRTIGILASDLQSHFLISDNILGYEDRSGEPDRNGLYGRGIEIRRSFQSTISQNTIRYWKLGAIIMDATYSMHITKNSTYCNKKRAIELRNWSVLSPPQRPQPFVYINRIDIRGTISGTSLPNNIIELFYNENCPTCEGKTWFANVTSDQNGNWLYNGPVNGDNIIATATEIFKATSEYSMPKIDTSALSVSPVACDGGYGAICGLRIVSGTKWRWEDASGTIVGYDTCLRLVPAGRYFLKLSIGSSCEESFSFVIPDVSPSIDFNNVNISTARCGADNGSICGLIVKNGISWRWEDENGSVVSNDLCFNNARPGRYRLRLEGQQSCFVYSPLFVVPDKVPKINAQNAVVVHPSCGANNGSVKGIQLTDMEFATRSWYNDQGILISNTTDLLNAAPGRYKLIVKDISGVCGDSTTYFTLNIVPPPFMNVSGVQLKDAVCGLNNGSISGITLSNVTGSVNYWWVNQSGSIVAVTPDLLNIPPGSYRLKVKDGSNCDTLFSPVYSVADKGSITLDSSAITITPTGCTKVTGSIKGLKVLGATNIEWRNTNTGILVGTTQDVSSLPAGNYQLTAVNTNYGCIVRSSVYIIAVAAPIVIEVLADSFSDATCGNNNGTISLTRFSTNTSLFSFRWLKDSSAVVGNGLTISGLTPATYYCIATDSNGCEKAIYKKIITAKQLPVLNENFAVVKADTCDLRTGSISGIVASSDIPGIQYVWYTDAGAEAGRSPALINISSGDYYLMVTDGRGCTVRSKKYTVPSINALLPAPRYNAVFNIARNIDVTLSPLNSRNGIYELYDKVTSQLIARNATGSFVLQRVSADRQLFVQYTAGACNSARAEIMIRVFDDTRLTIPNAFSPNNDGINDLFRIQVLGYFKLNHLKIFNRWGQMIYESRDLNLTWDGRRNGNPLPVGTYYWILEGIDMNNKVLSRSGSITLIR